MRKLILIIIAASSVLASCNSDKKAAATMDSTARVATDTTTVETAESFANGCYTYTKNKDTISLALKVAGEEITGELNYRLFEKDSNKGTMAGEIKGDTIIAEYDFNSEGVRSIREIVFLKKDGKLHEGFGEVETKGMKTMFKNRANLNFGNAIVLEPTDCK